MSFDDLFALLLFIVFIGLPLLNRLQQRGRGGAPPGAPQPGRQRPSAATQPRAPQAGRAGGPAAAGERETRAREERAGAERAAPSAQTATDTGRQRRQGDPFAELAERLEEARRRVREASGAGGAGASASQDSSQRAGQARAQASSQSASPPAQRTIATPAPPSKPIPDARADQPRRPRAARDPFPKASERPPAPWNRGTSARRASLSDDAPALEVERPSRTRLSSGSERRAREVARLRADDLVTVDPSSFRKGMLWHLVLSDPVAYRNRRKPSPPASR